MVKKFSGVPRDRGSQYQVESLESAKKVGHPLWLDNHVSRGASNVSNALVSLTMGATDAYGADGTHFWLISYRAPNSGARSEWTGC